MGHHDALKKKKKATRCYCHGTKTNCTVVVQDWSSSPVKHCHDEMMKRLKVIKQLMVWMGVTS